MRKIKAGAVVKSVVGRLAHPGHLFRAIKLHRARRSQARAYDDAQLALLAEFLPSGFLHYGYFDDPARCPEDISIREIERAQERYAEMLIAQVGSAQGPVMDIGCGMGGLSRMLHERGFRPVALTPDRLQARHIRENYPDIPVIESKFEDLPEPTSHRHKYDAVFTSESLQYLKLDRALPLLANILRPGGRWIACDYFRTGPDASDRRKGGHPWESFIQRVEAAGWQVTSQLDITPNVLPTLRYIHLWATRGGLPLLRFGILKVRSKHPALHYVLQDVLGMLDGVIQDNLALIDADVFAANKRYMLLVLQKRDAGPTAQT